MITLRAWYLADALAEAGVWDETADDYLTALAAQNDELAERRGNLCPECDGGIVTIFHSHLRDWETGEYLDTEEVPCTACAAGLLLVPADVVAIDHEALDAYHYSLSRDHDQDEEAMA